MATAKFPSPGAQRVPLIENIAESLFFETSAEAIYLPVQILNSSKAPVLKPRKGNTTSKWQWDVLAESFDGRVVMRHVVVLASGKMGKATKRRLRSLETSFLFRKCLS